MRSKTLGTSWFCKKCKQLIPWRSKNCILLQVDYWDKIYVDQDVRESVRFRICSECVKKYSLDSILEYSRINGGEENYEDQNNEN